MNPFLCAMSGANVILVLSGGQTGADEGALAAAAARGVATGGYMPRNCETEAGARPDLAERYGLEACDGGYGTRDRLNVDALVKRATADATSAVLAFRLRLPMTGAGTNRTVTYALTGVYPEAVPVLSDSGATVQVHEVADAGRPCAIVVYDVHALSGGAFDAAVAETRAALRERRVAHVLVSGPCESTVKGMYVLVRAFVSAVLQ